MNKTILIVVTHLLGAGHLTRALILARAFAEAGHAVHVASGGVPTGKERTGAPVPGLHFHQLPPLRSDGTNFSRLLDEKGLVADDSYRAGRCRALVDLAVTLKPDVLITELYPFGRRALKQEFEALLQAISPATRVFASVRDILAPPSKPAKASYAHDMVARSYDGVLVHADQHVIGLQDSWPVTPALADKLQYTGFVAPALLKADPLGDGKNEVLVSAGGGNVGDALFQAALGAAARDNRRWRLLVGGSDAAARVAQLASQAPAHAVVEPARPDFRQMLTRAAASVSFCGYNTAVDLIQTGVPAVITPFDDGGETEQTQRAAALARMPGIEAVAPAQLTPDALLKAVQAALNAPARAPSDKGMQGASETVRLCVQ